MIAGVLGMGRSMAESRMTDQCIVTRPGPKTWDEDEGEWTYPMVTVFAGKCRVKHPTVAGKSLEAAGQLAVVSQTEIHLPMSAGGVAPADAVEVTASPTRADQLGRKFVVAAPFDGSQTTALRFRVEAFDER